MDKLHAMLERHEGKKLHLYDDAQPKLPPNLSGIKGHLSIGYGYNIEDNGISDAVADFILEECIKNFITGLNATFPWFKTLDTVRSEAIIDFTYNRGVHGVKEFPLFVAAMERGDYHTAAYELTSSKWATEVGQRANELAAMLVTGEYPN